ncbi:MAG: type II CAAX endopeptidase family protein [Elainellaceae cyanobacterium]
MKGTQLKRLILLVITLIVVALLGNSLVASLGEPQVTGRLQLYQTDLLLQATEIGINADDADLTAARNALVGEKPFETALEQYQSVRESAETSLNKFQAELQTSPAPSGSEVVPTTPGVRPVESPENRQLQSAIQQQQTLLNQLDLRIGLLQAEQGNVSEAIATWTALVNQTSAETTTDSLIRTTNVLIGLWNEPPRILPDAEEQLQRQLDGWFRYRALTRLYGLQQRSEALQALQATAETTAQQTLVKLALVGILPAVGGIIGFVLLVIVIARSLVRKQADSENLAWEVPWEWETILQVLIIGFFFMGQVLIPLILGSLGLNFTGFGSRAKAAYTLTYYLLMAGSGLLVLFLSIKSYLPLPEGWFRLKGQRNWVGWGVGGYFVALPLMLGVSLINQQIWQGQGGSNPLLQTVLEEGDTLALGMFFFTAAIAAPIFEELLFRGFLLPSLTRYVPVWGAIGLSALLFAIAHLSFSEVLPLLVLGAILGFVYTRSRSILAPMLLHSLWNSVTMIGLLILGSGA